MKLGELQRVEHALQRFDHLVEALEHLQVVVHRVEESAFSTLPSKKTGFLYDASRTSTGMSVISG